MANDPNERITELLKDFKSPHFAEGATGTLHGGTYAVDGYRFFHVQLLGDFQIKTAKGCTLHFSGKTGEFSRPSESRDIETRYSKTLQKGMTEFDFALDKEDIKLLESCEQIRIVFPKLFGKTQCEFTVNNKAHLQKVLK
jgi:hypothetical protein